MIFPAEIENAGFIKASGYFGRTAASAPEEDSAVWKVWHALLAEAGEAIAVCKANQSWSRCRPAAKDGVVI